MTTLLLIRHGQSEANLARRFAGHWDAPLTELGHQQAACTAAFVADTYSVDAVYASDLCRAFATGEAVAKKTGVAIQPEAGLREIEAGQWEGLAFAQLEEDFSEEFTVWRQDVGNSCPTGGEAVAELAKRVENTLRWIAQSNPGKTVVIATHATPIRSMQWKVSGKPLGYMKEIPWVSNASVTELFYENGEFRLGKIAQDSHMEELKTTLPANV